MRNKLKEYRGKEGITQAVLSKLTGIKITTISNYEMQIRGIPIKNAVKFGKVFNINWWELYEIEK